MSLQIGSYQLSSKLLLAPMAGITDRPYRDVCRQYGAGLAASEMLSSDPSLLKTRKTQLRLVQDDEPLPRSAQILGTEPSVMAQAAQFNVRNGANIIDINMGCPAKKVCNKAAGSALMRDTTLVKQILTKVVSAVNVPVTLKIRTGWASSNRNALEIAKIAEDQGIACLTIHGRSRFQAFTGYAEYETIRQVKQAVNIPVIANGDIKDSSDASFILDYTGVDGLMLGRITHGQPWIFKEINDKLCDHFLNNPASERHTTEISLNEKINTTLGHINAIHRYYGTDQGVRIARKHIGWYLYRLTGQDDVLLKKLKKEIFTIVDANSQLKQLESILGCFI
jgi:tRNA-dihydrouridine synthase B